MVAIKFMESRKIPKSFFIYLFIFILLVLLGLKKGFDILDSQNIITGCIFKERDF